MSFLTTKEGMAFRCIRHHHVYVFSDCKICHHYHFLFGMSFLTTKEGMTFRRIRHRVYVFSDCKICHHYHFLFGMSFLTTKEGMTFRRIRHHHVYVFSDCQICRWTTRLLETWRRPSKRLRRVGGWALQSEKY